MEPSGIALDRIAMLNRKRGASTAAKQSVHSAFATPHSPFPLRILGIDPGLNITGYGVLERNEKKF